MRDGSSIDGLGCVEWNCSHCCNPTTLTGPPPAPSPPPPPPSLLPCSLWVLGNAACALAPAFPALLLCRLLVGAACGPFIALVSPLIDDLAPSHQKSLWLATLFLCMPSGFAMGYILGGVVSSRAGLWVRCVGCMRGAEAGHQAAQRRAVVGGLHSLEDC